jgi:hypothetical protein
MERNEIRLRRNLPGAGKSKRHQNYSALMRRHNRYLKLKRILYILYIVVFVFLFILLFLVIRLQNKKEVAVAKQTEKNLSIVSDSTKTTEVKQTQKLIRP